MGKPIWHKAVSFILAAVGFILVVCLITAALTTRYISPVSIRFDVHLLTYSPSTTPDPNSPHPELTDTTGALIPPTATYQSAGPCVGLCAADWGSYTWTPAALSGHSAPFTLTLVGDGDTLGTLTADSWTSYRADPENGSYVLSRGAALPSTWYQTGEAKIILIVAGALGLIKALSYAAIGLRSLPRWIALTTGNALLLPLAWSFANSYSGHIPALAVTLLTLLWDVAWLMTAPDLRPARWRPVRAIAVPALISIGGFLFGYILGLRLGVIIWGVLY